MHFLDAASAGELIGISGHAFRKRAERYGIRGQVWGHARVKWTAAQVAEVQRMGRPPAGNRQGIAHRRKDA